MLEITFKLCLGILLGGISFYGLIANALVVVPVYRLAFVSKRSPIYVISLVNLFADVVNLIITTCYLAPLILTTAYTPTRTTNLKTSFIFGTGFMFCWYLGSITQIIMSVNRLVVICFKCPDLFSRKVLLVIFSFIFPLCTAMTYLAQFGFPCCALVYDSRILSISYLSTGAENFSNMFIDVPLNFTTSFTAFVCYSMITIKIWSSKKMVLPTAGNKEYAYATQFCLITVFYTISWILFRIFPLVLGNQRVEFYCFVMIAVSLNNSANAAVYICFNKELLHFMMRVPWLDMIYIWHVLGASFGCFANLLLLYAVFTKTPRQTKTYAVLIINFAITDFTECLMDLFIQLRFIITPFDVTLIYVFHGLCRYTGSATCKIGLSLFYHCFPHNVWSLLLSFSYRYYVLHHRQTSRRVLVLIILIIYMPSFIQAMIYWPTVVNREIILPYADRYFPQYNLSHADGLLAGIPTIKDFASIYVILHLCGPIFPIYVAIFVLRHKVMNNLLRKTEMLSNDLKSYHSQILKCLTIQAAIPMIFVIGVISYLSAQLGIFTHPILEYSIFACTLPMPMFSPFTYLLYIRPYRMFCLRLLKRNDVENSQAERSKQVFSTG